MSVIPLPAVAKPRRAMLIINPSKPRADITRAHIAHVCRTHGVELDIEETTIAHPGRSQALAARDRGVDRVLVAGGDGTVREVAAALAHSNIPIGIVPIGTANLFGRNIGLTPRKLDELLDTALGSTAIDIDLGQARMLQRTDDGVDVWTPEHPFLVVAGIGHDAATVLNTSDTMKRRVGWLAYFASGIRHLTKRPIPMDLALDSGTPRRISAWTVIVGNCGRIPGGITVIPHAVMNDGELDLAEVTVSHVAQWVPISLKGLTNWSHNVSGLIYRRIRECTITPYPPSPVQLDGDVFDMIVTLKIRNDPRAIRVMINPHRFPTKGVLL